MRRRVFVAAGVLVLAAAAGLVLALGGRDEPSDPLVGFNDNAVETGLVPADTDADVARRAGATTQRVVLDWRKVEPRKDSYSWLFYDGLYRSYRKKGIRPLFVVMWAPPWAWGPDARCDAAATDCHLPPGRAHDGEWRQLVQLVTKRYSEAAGIEVWNEPNIGYFWGPRPDARRFVELVREARDAVHQAGSSLPVIAGGLSNVQRTVGTHVSLKDYAEAIYRAGAKGSMDGLAVHPYPQRLGGMLLQRSLAQVRGVQRRYHDTTPLWITEIGLSTTGQGQPRPASPTEQARGLVSIYKRLRAMSDVKAIVFHTLFEPRGAPTDPEVGFGVVRRDLRPKPAYCALTRELGPKTVC